MVEDPTPGGGGQELRKQLGIMKDFLEQFGLVKASEKNAIVATTVPDGLRSEIRVLFDRSRSSWGMYVPRGPRVELGLELPFQFYHVEWIDPQDGKVLKAEDLDARGRITTGSGLQPRGDRNSPKSHKTTNTTRVDIRSPEYAEDLAVRITARDPHKRGSPEDVSSRQQRLSLVGNCLFSVTVGASGGTWFEQANPHDDPAARTLGGSDDDG